MAMKKIRGAWHLSFALERPPIHLLRVAVLALISQHQPEIVDAGKRRCMIVPKPWPPRRTAFLNIPSTALYDPIIHRKRDDVR